MGKRVIFFIVIALSGVVWSVLTNDAIEIASATSSEDFGNLGATSIKNQAMIAGTRNNAPCGSSEEMIQSCREMEQRILSTTLRIEIKTWIIYVEDQGYTTLFSNGHGTVIDGRYLLTHNHFRLPLLDLLADEVDGDLATITLYTAAGDLLWQGPLTTAAVAFDDSETLLLEFLDQDGRGLFESLGIPSAEFMAVGGVPIANGAPVAQVNWDENQAYVQWTEVKAMAQDKETPAIDLADCLVPGSSGGGVFLNGIHIANNWSRSMGCVKASDDEALLYSTAALNSMELFAAVQ